MNDHAVIEQTPVTINLVDRVNAKSLLERAADKIHGDESLEESANAIQASIKTLDEIKHRRTATLPAIIAFDVWFALRLTTAILERDQPNSNAVDDPAGLARDIAERIQIKTPILPKRKRNNP